MLHRKPRILVVGSFVMDVIAATEKIPGSGQTVYGKSFHMAPGGKGANQALQCARLGADVTMMGAVGDDLFGQQLLEPLQAAGMDTSHVAVHSGIHSGVGHVTLEVTEHTAQNRIVVIPGANRTLTVDEVRWIQDAVSGYDLVLLQLEVPIEVNRAVARWAREAGVPVILNPAPATELDDKLLSLVSYLIPNEQEASQETHLPLRFDGNGPHDEDLRAIAAALRAKGVEHVIITLGGYGSAVAEASGPRYIPCVRMEHVADPTAAGDSFVGALSTALAVGLTEDEALTFASFTAAITVSRLGAMPALPTLPEVLGLIENRGGAGFAEADGTAFVFMGHGTSHTAKISYSQMQSQMNDLGYNNVFIGTVEGEPEDTACEAVIEKIKEAGYKKVVLRPLMVVAGDHANNDMAGDDEDSWKSQFEASGAFDKIDTQIAGLGEIAAIQDLYVAHTKAAMDGNDAAVSEESEETAGTLEDGTYEAEFDTDSGMFHVNEANDGKGILTVKDGKMTIHISLVSKNIVNLYVGKAADAQKDGAELLQPTTDTITYDDGSTEEVYGFDVPVKALDETFDLALVGTKGKWYDHEVSVSDPVKAE